jgi:hypothetical protein
VLGDDAALGLRIPGGERCRALAGGWERGSRLSSYGAIRRRGRTISVVGAATLKPIPDEAPKLTQDPTHKYPLENFHLRNTAGKYLRQRRRHGRIEPHWLPVALALAATAA